MTEKSAGIKASREIRPQYARFYASKWRSGTLMLSLEEEGLYIRVSAFQMECGQPVPMDWKDAARLLCVQPLKYRKTVDSLVAKGKLLVTPDGIICERAMAEFKRAAAGAEVVKQDPPTSPHTYPDTYPDSMGVEAKKDQQNQDQNRNNKNKNKKEEEIQAAAPVQEPAAAAKSKLDLKDFETKLFEACNGSLDNPVNCMGLLNLSTPQMWIANGCDLELDVLPTLTAAGKKYHGKRIRDWGYFTSMIAEAKAKRTAGLPAVGVADRPANQPKPHKAGQPTVAEVLARRKAREIEAGALQ